MSIGWWVYLLGFLFYVFFGNFKVNDRPVRGLPRVILALMWPAWLAFAVFLWCVIMVIWVLAILGIVNARLTWRGRVIRERR